MIYVLYGIYILACVFLILVVLLQSGKGGDVAAAFGGGSQTAFGPRGAQKPLEKATIGAAAVFMFLALVFSLPGVTGGRSVVKAPVETATPTPAPGASAPAAAAASPEASATVSASPAATASAAPSASPVSSAAPEKK